MRIHRSLFALALCSLLAGCAPEKPIQRGKVPIPDGAEATKVLIDPDAGETAGVTANEILIGSCSALEGPAAYLGTQMVTGARAYLNYVNEQGGVYGRKIKLLSHNDEYDPQKAVACFNLLLKERVFAGAFFVGTPTAAKYIPMAESNRVPLIGLFTGAQILHEPFRPHVLSVRASYADEVTEQINHLHKDLKLKKFALIYQDDAFGAAITSSVKKVLESYALEPVAMGSFARNSLDVESAVVKVKAANPDVVIIAAPYGSAAAIVKKAHSLKWHPLFTSVSFIGAEAFIAAAGKDAEGTVITQVVPPYSRDDLPTVALYKRLLRKNFPDEKPNFVSFEGFVDAMVLVEGLKRAGPQLTRTKFISAVEGIRDFDMGLGSELRLNYGPRQHKGLTSVYFTAVKNGQIDSFSKWSSLKLPKFD